MNNLATIRYYLHLICLNSKLISLALLGNQYDAEDTNAP